MKNQKFRQVLVDVIKQAGVEGGCPKPQGALLYTVAGKVGLYSTEADHLRPAPARQQKSCAQCSI